ncbi:MAG: NAD(P)H-quinone oxidoreductase [Acetobacter sp.]|uniref:NAD(P)H-quinone oxidoreductase n=1 Tax=Acetobacter sp. TaxID=440 RepID=UPI0039E916BF
MTTGTMQAVIAEGKGGPEVLRTITCDIPRPGAQDVLIRVAVAGVNRPDIGQRTGALPVPADASAVLGLEVAGRVVNIGEGVNPDLIGQNVMALVKSGGYAQYVVAKAAQCLLVPDGLSLTQAAILPEGLFTLWHNLFDRGALASGDWVLIEGGASGIGTLGLQLAQAIGARVIVTAGGPEKCKRLAQMGAIALDYQQDDIAARVMDITAGQGVNVVLDILGGDAVNQHLFCMAPQGRHIGLSFMQGAMAPVDLGLVMGKGLWLSSSTMRPKSDEEKALICTQVKHRLLPLIAQKKVLGVLCRTFPLEQACQAHEFLESGSNFGKIALVVQEEAEK